MPTQRDLDAARVYTSIMEEAKFRALSINTLTRSRIGLPVLLLGEFCFLELRMLCELIALGCLVAHGAQFSIQRTYAASIDEAWALWTTKSGIESWWGPEG